MTDPSAAYRVTPLALVGADRLSNGGGAPDPRSGTRGRRGFARSSPGAPAPQHRHRGGSAGEPETEHLTQGAILLTGPVPQHVQAEAPA